MKNRVFTRADILLPKSGFEKWSVIACDQHTSEPEYWERVDEIVGGAPSTLRMMLPEHLYKSPRLPELIRGVRAAADSYMENDIFRSVGDSYVYVERTLKNGRVRRGLVGAIDLEQYSSDNMSDTMIRATEGMVKEKIPVRMAIRRGARIECPHVMLLLDDPSRVVIEPLAGRKSEMEKLYDFELMEGGGRVAGWRVAGGGAEELEAALDLLSDQNSFSARYGVPECAPVMLFATGDGNHSLATAKFCWDEIRAGLTESQRLDHPARYALVELVNIMDAALDFFPINRVVTGVEPDALIRSLMDFWPGTMRGHADGHVIACAAGGSVEMLTLPGDSSTLAIAAVSAFLDAKLPELGGDVDFIHGDDVVVKLSEKPKTTGFIFSAVDKLNFFKSIVLEGALPRKTFSMGEAWDKRYYLECRKIDK